MDISQIVMAGFANSMDPMKKIMTDSVKASTVELRATNLAKIQEKQGEILAKLTSADVINGPAVVREHLEAQLKAWDELAKY